MLKTGASPFPRKFTEIIVAGHSQGSVITHQLSVTYPNDASAYILTGYSKFYANILAGIFVTGLLLPAAVVQPAKYGNLPVGYLEPSSESGLLYLFWYDPYANGTYYDPAFPAFDYALRESITVGEAATDAVVATTLPTSATTGHVLVITGQQDVLFCGTTALVGAGPGQCVGGPLNYLANTGELYPSADYSYWSVPNAGHLWQFHYSAQEGFEYTHNWLTSRGY
jgi:pimeloyl-ACP methyl ester carboxylesterase